MKVHNVGNFNSNSFGSKVMVTPGAEELAIDCKWWCVWKELGKQSKRLAENNANDIVLIDRCYGTSDISMRVYENTTNELRANERFDRINYYGIDYPFGFAVEDAYKRAKIWISNFVPNRQVPELANYHIDKWVQDKRTRIIITNAAMNRFRDLKSKKPDITDTFLKGAKSIESNGNDDKLLIDVEGELGNESLVLYLYEKVNGMMKRTFYPQTLVSVNLENSYNIAKKNGIKFNPHEWESRRLSAIYSIV